MSNSVMQAAELLVQACGTLRHKASAASLDFDTHGVFAKEQDGLRGLV
jgi:hypothetical protein